MTDDPYVVTERTIREPPSSFLGKLKFLGPGFILSASIVGSGELIATTTLGAKAGFVACWIILLSCLVKVAVQLEFGKNTILTGQTAVQAFGNLPGPKFGKGRWSVWIVFLALTLKTVQVGGILGGSALVLNMMFPGISLAIWTLMTALVTSLIIYKGYYKPVEKFSLFMIAMFTVLTLTSLILLQQTPYHFSLWDVLQAQNLELSSGIVWVAIGAFGITGVASDEIIAYTYWCIEKGYAAYTGPKDETDSRKRRAKGWINIMYLDAAVAMLLYTTVTTAFYLLGASVLHVRGEVPDESRLVETLALIFTQSLGPGSKIAFLIGGFFVLYSSLFATLAFWSRTFPDIFGQLGWINFNDVPVRKKTMAILSWTLPFIWSCLFLFLKLPLIMILSGGVVGSFLLLLVAFGALNFRYRSLLPSKPSLLYDLALWVSVLSILTLALYTIVKI